MECNLDKYQIEMKYLFEDIKNELINLEEAVIRCENLWKLIPHNYLVNPFSLMQLIKEKYESHPDYHKYNKTYKIPVNK